MPGILGFDDKLEPDIIGLTISGLKKLRSKDMSSFAQNYPASDRNGPPNS
jgi:hypothetical protein